MARARTKLPPAIKLTTPAQRAKKTEAAARNLHPILNPIPGKKSPGYPVSAGTPKRKYPIIRPGGWRRLY